MKKQALFRVICAKPLAQMLCQVTDICVVKSHCGVRYSALGACYGNEINSKTACLEIPKVAENQRKGKPHVTPCSML